MGQGLVAAEAMDNHATRDKADIYIRESKQARVVMVERRGRLRKQKQRMKGGRGIAMRRKGSFMGNDQGGVGIHSGRRKEIQWIL